MDQNNFLDTVTKKLQLDYSKGKFDAGEDFLSLFDDLDKCEIDIEFSDSAAEVAGLKQAIIRAKAPAEVKGKFDKYKDIVVHTASDLYGARDGYMISDLICDVLAEAQAV